MLTTVNRLYFVIVVRVAFVQCVNNNLLVCRYVMFRYLYCAGVPRIILSSRNPQTWPSCFPSDHVPPRTLLRWVSRWSPGLYLEFFSWGFQLCLMVNKWNKFVTQNIKNKKVPNAKSFGTELQIRRCLVHWFRLFLIPCSTCQKAFSSPDLHFSKWMTEPTALDSFFFITQSFTLPSIIETRQAAPHPNSTSTNMAELCMLSCGKRDSLQSGCDLHNLCSPRHQCDPSCNSSQSPLHPLPRPGGMS